MRAWLSLAAIAASSPAFAADADRDGIVNGKDACRDVSETVNRWRDDDGCPDQLGVLEVLVLDLEGRQVAGAVARVGGADQRTDADGRATFRDLLPEQVLPLAVEAPGFAAWADREAAIVEGSARVVATLDWQPVEVHVEARDAESHARIATLVRADGPGYVASQPTAADGDAVLWLRPGAWTLRVESPQHQTTTLAVAVNRAAPAERLTVELRPAWVAFADLDLSFAPGSAALGPDRAAAVQTIAAAMFGFPELRFAVTGHADPRPKELSLARVEAVRDGLVAAGVDPARLTVVAAGDADPLATPWLAAGQAANRSVTAASTLPEALPSLTFAPGDDRPDDAALADLAARLTAAPDLTVTLVGRRDPSDDALGLRRAEAGVAALRARGVPAARLVALQGAPSPAGLTVLPTTGGALPEALYFARGAAELLPESAARVPELAARLGVWPDLPVAVIGHLGADEPDPTLAVRRAEAVRAALGGRGVVVDAGAWLPARLPAGATDVGGYVSFAALPPPLFALPAVPFAFGEVTPGPEVDRLADVLRAHPGLQIALRGHASPVDGAAPEGVAQARAAAVADALTRRGLGAATVAWTVDADASGGARVVAEVVALPIDTEVAFAPGAADLDTAAIVALDGALPAVLAAPGLAVEIVGRAEGDEAADALARARGEAVARWLIGHGVDEGRVWTTGAPGGGTTIRLAP